MRDAFRVPPLGFELARALAASLITLLAVAPDAQTVLGRGPAAALFLVGGAVANLVGATAVERLGIRDPDPDPDSDSDSGTSTGTRRRRGRRERTRRVRTVVCARCSGASRRCRARVAGGEGGLFAGFARPKATTHTFFGGAFEASSTSLLWVTLAGRALGGLGDVGVWTCGVGAAVGWYARTWGVV